jgi:hypothetical protein
LHINDPSGFSIAIRGGMQLHPFCSNLVSDTWVNVNGLLHVEQVSSSVFLKSSIEFSFAEERITELKF